MIDWYICLFISSFTINNDYREVMKLFQIFISTVLKIYYVNL